MKVEVITHFDKNDDPECCGDYIGVTVFVNGTPVSQYGDYYHDKGEERASGFVNALQSIFGDDVSVEYKNIANAEDYDTPDYPIIPLENMLNTTII